MDSLTIVLGDITPPQNIIPSNAIFTLNSYTTASGTNLIANPTTGMHLGVSVV